ncbi:transposase [Rubinisphaera margarita]|uniref:transposase n=1 Tax=Rubinisphaera margarita TaxID=2909586 RepID=UPI001EE87A70|nr:transposase [Rubinisphaera margarita]MCG6158481.1 transposase [Rubinisphaera margarita]
MSSSHRKRIKHYHEPGDLHELTFSTYQRLPLLRNSRWQSWLAESVTQSCRQNSCRLIAFVFMPEHVHLWGSLKIHISGSGRALAGFVRMES